VIVRAAGPADTGLMAAELIAPGGTLISSDFVEPMLDVARERARELGIENVEFRLLDAEWLDLEAASVDAILCRWGYMLMADPAAALRESRRVLRPGGRLALAAWDAPERNPWVAAAAGQLVRRGHAPPPDPDAPSMFAFAPEGRIVTLLEDSGFMDIRVDGVDIAYAFDDLDDWWSMLLDCGRPLSLAVAQLPDDEVESLRAAAAAELAEYRRPDGGLVVPGRSLVAAASA
jgi:SAM-dependent methyltransferase